jgi:predicted AAA+ superfamily ATPase
VCHNFLVERKLLIKEILSDWSEHLATVKLFERESTIPPLSNRYITTLTGPRRAGKTSVLQLLAKQHNRLHPDTPALYVNFEDERLDRSTDELRLILECYRELYPSASQEHLAFFFDEIQVVPQWERFVRRCHEGERAHVAITGSNSRALSTDIATALRGRTINGEILPLSFREFFRLKSASLESGRAPSLSSARGKARAHAIVEEYLEFGGFPEVALEPNPHLKAMRLQEYFQVMVVRDLVERFRVNQVPPLRFFLKRLLASAARPVSVHKIYQEIKSAGHRISKDAAYEFLEYAEAVYFVRTLPQFTRKRVQRELGERKIYPIDLGYLRAIIGDQDRTKALETAVWFDFFFRRFELSYFKGASECDFVVSDQSGLPALYQVAYSLDDNATKEREFRGLREAAAALGSKNGIVVTRELDKDFKGEAIDILARSFLHFSR